MDRVRSALAWNGITDNHEAGLGAVFPIRPPHGGAGGAAFAVVGNGIGRFAFTPLLPMMLHDGLLDLQGGSWLATANYLGYFVGAALCAAVPFLLRHGSASRQVSAATIVKAGLVVTAILTLAMAVEWPEGWLLWRFLSGVTSAVVFVYTSSWCLQTLAGMEASALGGIIFMGPGVGIIVTGLMTTAMVACGWHAETGWLAYGALAVLLAALVWPVVRNRSATPQSAPARQNQPQESATKQAPKQGLSSNRNEIIFLAAIYGLAGFGYIITATYLPVIARESLPASQWADLFWPVFGLGVALGALLVTRLPLHWDQRDLLVGGYMVQAAGVLACVLFPSVPGFVLGSLLTGAPLTALTLFAMREVRRLNPLMASSLMGLLTAVYGIGQILGPPLATALVSVDSAGRADFSLSLYVAASALLGGAAGSFFLRLRYPA